MEEVLDSPVKELAKFKSRTETGSEFYFYINNLVVLKDEETVIGVLNDDGETLEL